MALPHSGLSKSPIEALLGHIYTLAPLARHILVPRRISPSIAFRVMTNDPDIGPVRLSGRLHHADADTLLVVVHGLGGDVGSHYVLDAALAGEAAGIAVLRIHLRGADRTGEDIYHAGMSHDMQAVLASPELARYSRIVLLGYSLGGHTVLRTVTESAIDSRVTAACAICPPLNLTRGADAIDQPARYAYRRHVLESIKDVYAAVARRRPMPLPVPDVRQIRTLREWDERVVAPRFGFRGAEHYYEEISVAPRLSKLLVSSLLIATHHDPMVPADTLAPVLESHAPLLDVRWIERGGHVGFPADVDIGESMAGEGLERQVVAWMLAQDKPSVTAR